MDNLMETNMIKYQKYFLTKDRKIGFEIKVWKEGYMSFVFECKGFGGFMLRRYRMISKKELKQMREEAFFASIISDLEGLKPHALHPLIPKSKLG